MMRASDPESASPPPSPPSPRPFVSLTSHCFLVLYGVCGQSSKFKEYFQAAQCNWHLFVSLQFPPPTIGFQAAQVTGHAKDEVMGKDLVEVSTQPSPRMQR